MITDANIIYWLSLLESSWPKQLTYFLNNHEDHGEAIKEAFTACLGSHGTYFLIE